MADEVSGTKIEDQIWATLLDDRTECISYGDGPGPTDAAIEACVGLAYLCEGQDRWAAFGETEGGVSLVLQPMTGDRRVDFRIRPDRICPDGRTTVMVVHLGPGGWANVKIVLITDRERLLEAARWVQANG